MKRNMMAVFYIITFGIVLLLAYIRFAPSDTDMLHKDPQTAASTGKPNEYRFTSTLFDITADELIRLIDDFVQNQPRTTRIAGAVDTKMITYVQRSVLMGYPDYITIKAVTSGVDQSKLVIFSRSRFGHSDLGVNKMRIDQWISVIRGMIAGR